MFLQQEGRQWRTSLINLNRTKICGDLHRGIDYVYACTHTHTHTHIYTYIYMCVCFSLALQPSAGYGHLVTRGFVITHNDASLSVGLLWTSDQLVVETSTWHNTTHNRKTSMPPVGFEPTIAACERPRTEWRKLLDTRCAAYSVKWLMRRSVYNYNH
jgi:hypothetical protein